MRMHSASLSELHAFVTVARTGSFARAAAELVVTQGAMSRAMARMEGHYGKRLLKRESQQLSLTPAGRQLLEEIQAPLAALEAASARLRLGRDDGHDITASIATALAEAWLMPRLEDFSARHPEMQLRLVPHRTNEDFSGSVPDCAVMAGFGKGQWPALASEYIIGREVVPVCSPVREEARRDERRWQQPGELMHEPLLHHATVPDAWAKWLCSAGVTGGGPEPAQPYALIEDVMGATIADLGVGLVPRFLAQPQIDAGRLVVPFDLPLLLDLGYFFCTPHSRQHLPGVAAFRRWLVETARRV